MNDRNRPTGLTSANLTKPILLFGKLTRVVQFAKVNALACYHCGLIWHEGQTDTFQACFAQNARAVLNSPLPELTWIGINAISNNPWVNVLLAYFTNSIVLDNIID